MPAVCARPWVRTRASELLRGGYLDLVLDLASNGFFSTKKRSFMPAQVVSLTPAGNSETVDFLRRLASMMSGGRNGEMLIQAAAMIESLTERATVAESQYQRQQQENARNIELRQVADVAADQLIAEVDALKAELATNARQAEIDRTAADEAARQLLAKTQDAEVRIAAVTVELNELRASVEAFDDSVTVVPVQSLRLARAQFDFLADGFAKSGDVISLTICEIGGCAIDDALSGKRPMVADRS